MATRHRLLASVPALLLLSGVSQASVVGVFHNNYGMSGTGSVFVFGAEGTEGTFTQGASVSSFTIDSTGVYTFSLGGGLQMDASGTVNTLSFRIESDDPISAIALNRETYTTDQANLLDIEALGKDYRILTYTGLSTYGGQMSVTAVEDDTEVTIVSPVALGGNPAGTPFTVTLNKGESIYYEGSPSTDISGTHVSSSKNVAVFAGVECANVPTGAVACDHLISQQYSTDNYDTEFLVSNSYGNGALGDLVRVIGATDGTEVFLNGVSVGTIDAGQVLEFDAGAGGVVTATDPVTMAQFMRGQSQRQAGIGDPAYEIIPSIDQLLAAYAFTTPVGGEAFSLNYLSLAIAADDADSLMLNGALVDTSMFTSISGWLFGTVAIGLGYGTIEADNPFLATISGYSDYDSYFSTIATAFSPGVSPPPDPETPAVPLPAGALLLAPALGLLAALRRRRS